MTEDMNQTTGGGVLLDIIGKAHDQEALVTYLLGVVSDLQRTGGRVQSA